jgi:hypothetical protein
MNRRFLRAHFMKYLRVLIILLSVAASVVVASEHRGQVRFGEVPIPGAIVQAKQGEKTLRVVTAPDGSYAFQDLSDGAWTLQVEMPGFEPVQREVVAPRDTAAVQWDLKMLPIDGMRRGSSPGFPAASSSAPALQTSAPSAETQDRLLINGSVSNGASTPFALAAGFGNNRRGGRSLYTGSVSVNGNNAVLDARSFSLTGQDTPRPAYNRLQSTLSVGGPFQIPGLFRNGSFTVSYSRTQNRNASLQTVQMPTAAERAGDFSNSPSLIFDPATGAPFSGNVIPQNRISPQARALADLYPLPNFTDTGRYNYQSPVLGVTHGDNLTGTINNFTINNSNRLSGNVSIQSTRSDNPDLFGFTDTGNTKGINGSVTWTHRFTQRVSGTIRYAFSRTVTESLPHFGTRVDVSGNAGITGNDRDPRNWGPPSLNFSRGIARLSSGSYAFDRNQASTFSYSSTYVHSRHAFSYGADYRRQQFNLLSQRDARGSFTFTGAASGNDFADFLLGIPTTSSIAFGNADKYFRQSFVNAYFTDDYRVKANLTLTLGARFEYESPMTERYGRLVNLDIAPDFSAATPRIAGTSHGVVDHRAGRVWLVSRYNSLSRDRGSDGAAVAAVEEPERAEHPIFSPDSCGGVPRFANHHRDDLRHRSRLPRRNRTELAAFHSTGPAAGNANDNDLSGNQGDACGAANPSQHISRGRSQSVRRLSLRLHLSGIRRQFQPPLGDDRSTAPSAQRFSGERSVHLCEGDRRCRHQRQSHRAELAGSQRGARPFEFRSEAPGHCPGSIHHRDAGRRWRFLG